MQRRGRGWKLQTLNRLIHWPFTFLITVWEASAEECILVPQHLACCIASTVRYGFISNGNTKTFKSQAGEDLRLLLLKLELLKMEISK